MPTAIFAVGGVRDQTAGWVREQAEVSVDPAADTTATPFDQNRISLAKSDVRWVSDSPEAIRNRLPSVVTNPGGTASRKSARRRYLGPEAGIHIAMARR